MGIELTPLLLDLKIDFSKTILERITGSGSNCNNFELSARDFIRFAKEDFSDSSKKGLINSLTNCKRAIDCQIDNTLEEFGIGFEKIDNSAELFVNKILKNNNDIAYKLKLIQALGFAPGILTSRIRNLRNKLEHFYKIPTKKEVEEAIEIAELYIMSIESKTKFYDYHFIISSQNFLSVDKIEEMKKNNYNIIDPQSFSTQLSIDFTFIHKKVELSPIKENKKLKKIIIKPNDTLYYFLLRLLNYLDDKFDCETALKDFIKYCGHPIPEKNINLAEYY